jgi:hypothetical protein
MIISVSKRGVEDKEQHPSTELSDIPNWIFDRANPIYQFLQTEGHSF